MEKVADDARWDGWKGYITNTQLPPQECIDQYHGLWVVERSFRISKGTLDMRPMFHFSEKRIEAHVCLCFVALKLYKELERLLKVLDWDLTVTITLPNKESLSQTLYLNNDQSQLKPLLVAFGL